MRAAPELDVALGRGVEVGAAAHLARAQDDRQLACGVAARRRLQRLGAAQLDAGRRRSRAPTAATSRPRSAAGLAAVAALGAAGAGCADAAAAKAASAATSQVRGPGPLRVDSLSRESWRAAGLTGRRAGESSERREAGLRARAAGRGRRRSVVATGAICRIDYPRGGCTPLSRAPCACRDSSPPSPAPLRSPGANPARAAAFAAWLDARRPAPRRSSPRRCGRRRATPAFAATSASTAPTAAASS